MAKKDTLEVNRLNTSLDEIWSVKYIPTKVEDLACTDEIRKFLTDCIENKEFPNHICLYGTPGTGKNSIVNIIKNNLDVHMLVINASEENGIDDIRGKVLSFANTSSFSNKPKIIVMNEADGLTYQAQNSMRELMETKSKGCRFILTCNYINNINPALKSRCIVYKVDPPVIEMIKRLAIILKKENVKFTKEFLQKFIKIKGRDLRKLLNDAQNLSKIYDELNENILENNVEDYITFFDEIFSIKDLKTIGDKIKEQLFEEDIYSKLANYCIERNFPAAAIPVISDHLFKSKSVFDKDLVFMSCLLTIKSTK